MSQKINCKFRIVFHKTFEKELSTELDKTLFAFKRDNTTLCASVLKRDSN